MQFIIILVLAVIFPFIGLAVAQEQPIDTRQYQVNPPERPAAIPQLPEQRTYPKDSWGRYMTPGGPIPIPERREDQGPVIISNPVQYWEWYCKKFPSRCGEAMRSRLKQRWISRERRLQAVPRNSEGSSGQ
jgi:hypothetical protein